MDLPSPSLARAVEALAGLPGIGRKTALRLALHLLKRSEGEVRELGDALVALRTQTRRCQSCGNLSDGPTCTICQSPKRQARLICVVADIQDLMAIEKTGQYNGRYHVLGGLISPLEGISPSHLRIQELEERLAALASDEEAVEVVFALNSSMEGETTAFYLAKKLKGIPNVQLSSIARGIPLGTDLEYTDDLTIARSLAQRVGYTLPE